jgi:hypothetical protein
MELQAHEYDQRFMCTSYRAITMPNKKYFNPIDFYAFLKKA